MAGLNFNVTSAGITLVAATAKTVIQLVAPANHRIKLKSVGIFCKGTSPTAVPVDVRIVKQTTAIGGSPTSLTPKVTNGKPETVQTACTASAGGTEPTSTDVYDRFAVHPQSGFKEVYTFASEIEIPGGERVGIEVTAAAGVDVVPTVSCEE